LHNDPQAVDQIAEIEAQLRGRQADRHC
jgi:hypothetical protein